MTVKVTKPAINVREELADLRKPTGIAGEAMLRAETPQEQFNLIGAGRRRINHNGAMQVSQRGTTFNSLADNTYTVDRYKWEISVIDQLVVNVTQVSDGPTGLANSLKLTVATPETAIEDNEFVSMVHVIEAQDMIQFGWGSDNPEPMSISFWVKSSIAGTYSISLYTQDGGRSIGRTYTINSANTWEYKTFFIPPDSVGFNDDNGGGVWFYINLAAGPNRTSADNTSWGGYTGGKLCYGQEVQLAETSGATWQITGFQVEKGSAATPFEHRSYGEELALCQRYYTRWTIPTQWPGYQNSTTAIDFNIYTPAPMRNGSPSISNTGSFYKWAHDGYQVQTSPSISVAGASNDQFNNNSILCTVSGFSGGDNGYVANVYVTNLVIDDEL